MPNIHEGAMRIGKTINMDEKVYMAIDTEVYLRIYDNITMYSFHSNYRLFDFLTPSLTTRLIQNFMQNIFCFVVSCFINTSSSRMT